MNYAIIAAGEGSRLREEGFKSVKPMVRLRKEYIIERLIRIFKQNKAESICIIINEESNELKKFLDDHDFGVKVNLIVKSTPSSLHSFWNILKSCNLKECCLTTVDTIFNEKEFAEYVSYFDRHKEIDAYMGVTKYIDDEKPLYVKTDENGKVSAYLDERQDEETDSVSAGIYCLREKATELADKDIRLGMSRMRNYQRSLLEAGLEVRSFLFGKVVDIDHVEDIKKAEDLLDRHDKHILCVSRLGKFSPNSQNKDALIMQSVAQKLRTRGYDVDLCTEEELSKTDKNYLYVLSMARSAEAIARLKQWESKGSVVLNTTLSIGNCFREKQIAILKQNGFSIPDSFIADTRKVEGLESLPLIESGDFWIKRGDFQTIEREDVIRCKTLEQAKEVLKNYSERNIESAVICSHVDGDVLKFYGVRGTDFIFSYYPRSDKFDNIINKEGKRNEFDKKKFFEQVDKLVGLLDLDIYGGDAIVDKEGNTYIIDINDFPSFSACRQEAGEKIVERFIKKAQI